MNNNELDNISTQQKKLDKLRKNLKTQFNDAYKSLSQCLSVNSAVMSLVYKTKSAISELRKLNTLLTDISKSNDQLSKSDLENLGNNAFRIADRYGRKSTDYLSAVQQAYYAGFKNTEGFAELSLAVQNAGNMTAQLANQIITAADKAYHLNGSVEDLTAILDGMNSIANHNALSMTELSQGLSVVSSTASSLGLSAGETAAALGTMIASTHQSGTEAANALKTILLNLRQISDQEEGIDTEGLKNYEQACNALNVQLRETRNGVLSLREPMEVLKELAAAYNTLNETDSRKSNLLSSVGGGLPASQLDALLRQWETYESMIQQYASGAGSMAAEAKLAADSWEGSMNRLSNTWTDTIGNIADSSAVTAIVNGLNSLLSIINHITDKLGSLPSIGLGAGFFAGLQNVGMTQLY